MNFKRTTLVIGAGASKAIHPEFGLGKDLVSQFIDRIPGDILRSRLKDKNITDDYIDRFVEAFTEYSINVETPSIDQFISEVNVFPEFENDRIAFRKIAKYSICYHILGYEGRMTDKDNKNFSNNWLSLLIKWLEDISFFNELYKVNSLKIVTFNYDRVFENQLLMSFPNHKNEVVHFIKNSVVHVYGHVGNLPTVIDDVGVKFGAYNDNINNWRTENLKLMFEERNDADDIDITRSREFIDTNFDSLISNEKQNKDLQVCFFGFAFDSFNCHKLNLESQRNNKNNYFANIHPQKFDYGYKYRREITERLRNISTDFNFSYLQAKDFLEQRLKEFEPNN
jgi:hypothetical protein